MTYSFSAIFKNDAFSSLFIMGMRIGMLAAKFLLSLFIARYMGLEMLGIYGLIISVSGTVQVCVRCGVFNVLSREAVHESKSALTVNLRHYFTGVFLVYLLIIPILVGIGFYVNLTALAVMASCVLMLEHVTFDIFTLISTLQKPKFANIMLSIQSAFWIYLYVALAFFIPSMRTLEIMMMFWICGSVTMTLTALFGSRHWPWKEAFSSKLQWNWYKYNLLRSWRLYVGEVLSVLSLYVDRYLITVFLSIDLLGVYVLFSQITNAISNLVNSGVLQVYRPRLIIANKTADKALFNQIYHTCVIRTFSSALSISLICAALVPYLVPYTNKPLAIHYIPLFWMMLASNIFRISNDIVKSYLYVRHQDGLIVKSNILGLVLCLTVGSVALCLSGIYGVIYTTIIVFGAVITYVEFRKDRDFSVILSR